MVRPAIRFKKLMRLDDLEVVESELVAGRRDEAVVGRMRRPHQHGLDALILRRAVGEIDADLVEPLLVEQDRAARPEDLQLEAALAAPGAAADLDRAEAPSRMRRRAVAMSKVSTARRPVPSGRSA